MNNREKGADNIVSILDALARLGYANTRQLAKWLFNSTTDTKRRMTNRILQRMIKRRMVYGRVDEESGERLIAASLVGMRHLFERSGQTRVKGKDWLRNTSSHRSACNSVLLASPFDVCYTELEIRAGQVKPGFEKCPYHFEGKQTYKIPDILLIPGGTYGEQAIWVEVENSHRCDAAIWRLAEWLRQMFATRRDGTRIHPQFVSVCFVIASKAASTLERRLNDAVMPLEKDGGAGYLRQHDSKLKECITYKYLDPETLTLLDSAGEYKACLARLEQSRIESSKRRRERRHAAKQSAARELEAAKIRVTELETQLAAAKCVDAH